MTVASHDIDQLLDEFALLDEWEDRYRHVIDLGRGLAAISDSERTEENRVHGCVSRVWLVTDVSTDVPPQLTFRGDSDAHIVKGLVAVLARMFSGRSAAEILEIDARAVFDRLGLSEHLTQQRSNGVNSLIERIRSDSESVHANR